MKKSIRPATVLTGILLMVFVRVLAGQDPANGWEETSFKANQAYKERRFKAAIDGYEQIIRSGHANGHIYYNLGNAYFKEDRLGRAILNYERAVFLMPRDADLNFNLRHARDQIKDDIPGSKGLMSTTFFWLDSLRPGEIFWAFAILNLLFWLTLMLRLFNRSDGTSYLLIILLIFWLITGTSFGLKWYQIETDTRVVILDKEVNALAGPDAKDTVLFKLHEGAVVNQERSEDGWFLINLPDEKRGWVKAGSVESVKQGSGNQGFLRVMHNGKR